MQRTTAEYERLGGGWRNPAWIVGLLCLATSAWVWHWVDQESEAAHVHRLQVEAERLSATLEERLDDALALLRGVQQHVRATETVSDDAWHAYLGAFDLSEYPGLMGVTFSEETTVAALGSMLERLRQNHPGATLFPAGDREGYRPILRCHPPALRGLLGFDPGTIPVARATQNRARDTGEPALTPLFRERAEASPHPDVVLYLPVYREEADLSSVATRREAHRAFVGALFDLPSLLGSIRSETLTFSLLDGVEPSVASVLYAYDEDTTVAKASAWSHVSVLSFGGRTWLMHFQPRALKRYRDDSARTALGVSLCVSVLLTGLVWVMGSTRRRALALAGQMTASLRESESRFRTAFESAAIGMAMVAPNGRFLRVNETFCKIVGYSPEEMLRKTYADLTHPDDLAENLRQRQRVLSGEASAYHLEKRYITRGGQPVWASLNVSLVRDDDERPLYSIAMIQDITERRQMEDKLRHLAAHDRLTGLPGRSVLLERLDQSLTRARRWDDYAFALLFLDLDGFKKINDTIGHQAGDAILVEVALRLQTQLRSNDVVARHGSGHVATRYGGDEFVVLLDRVAEPADAAILAERLRAALGEPYPVGGRTVECSPSVGIATSATGYVSADEMLHAADQAMYADKAARRNRRAAAAAGR